MKNAMKNPELITSSLHLPNGLLIAWLVSACSTGCGLRHDRWHGIHLILNVGSETATRQPSGQEMAYKSVLAWWRPRLSLLVGRHKATVTPVAVCQEIDVSIVLPAQLREFLAQSLRQLQVVVIGNSPSLQPSEQLRLLL
jgi:hypothetical protein